MSRVIRDSAVHCNAMTSRDLVARLEEMQVWESRALRLLLLRLLDDLL